MLKPFPWTPNTTATLPRSRKVVPPGAQLVEAGLSGNGLRCATDTANIITGVQSQHPRGTRVHCARCGHGESRSGSIIGQTHPKLDAFQSDAPGAPIARSSTPSRLKSIVAIDHPNLASVSGRVRRLRRDLAPPYWISTTPIRGRSAVPLGSAPAPAALAPYRPIARSGVPSPSKSPVASALPWYWTAAAPVVDCVGIGLIWRGTGLAD